MKDHFNKKAETWDEGAIRVNGAAKIAEAINRRIPLHKEMEIMDCGV